MGSVPGRADTSQHQFPVLLGPWGAIWETPDALLCDLLFVSYSWEPFLVLCLLSLLEEIIPTPRTAQRHGEVFILMKPWTSCKQLA